MYLTIRTGFSFKETFGHIPEIITKVKSAGFAGVTDYANTFSYVEWEKECVAADIKPIFGVRIPCCLDLEEKNRRGVLNDITLIALNQEGLKSIYKAVELATKQFWYTPRLTFAQIAGMNLNNVAIIGGYKNLCADYYQQISIGFPKLGIDKDLQPIAVIENRFTNREDQEVYESFADSSFGGFESQTYPLHIPTYEEWQKICKNKKALKNMVKLAKSIDHVKLQKAPLVKSSYKEPEKILKKLCKVGSKRLHVDLKNGEYADRYKHELKIVTEKGFVDYFLLVADLVKYAKSIMAVGAGRGSSGGSLICWLLGITGIDPIRYDLVFERFIDINRTDLPDIDIDFQDTKRNKVLPYLAKKYSVAQIANISRLTPKANLNRIAKAICVPEYDLTAVKNLTSDTKADAATLAEIFETDTGQELLAKHPHMADCLPLENHPLHTSVHAAGIIVSDEPITNFCAINSREREPVAMVDMNGCEHLNLLKVDALGLKTLSIIADTCDQLDVAYSYFYDLKDGDKKTYKLINSGNLTGIFQMEGRTIKKLIEGLQLESIEDLSVMSALGRTGPMKSGATSKYVKRKLGQQEVELPDNHQSIADITAETFGVIVYQEQIMRLAREYAGLEWADVINLRKAVAKSKGTEELMKFREMFVAGAKGDNPEKVWDMIKTFGGYGFVKAHAVAYAYITYWCAYLKAHHPLEFAVALLNNSDNDNKCIEILRFLDKQEGIKHKAFDIKHSTTKWKVHGKKVLGPLSALHGIGIRSAQQIIKIREVGGGVPAGIGKHIDNGITPFKYIYPRKQLYSDYRGTNIDKITKEKEYWIVGKLIKKTLKDANSIDNIKNRNGEKIDGPTTYLNLIVADDTGDMMVIINRTNYERIGEEITKYGKEDETWLNIKGKFVEKMNIIFADSMEIITKNG